MSLDPRLAIIARADANRAGLHSQSELDRRLRTQEQARPTVQSVAGTPTTAPRDGTLAADSVNTRLWVRVAGAWVFTPLLSSPPAPVIARGQVTLTWAASAVSNVATVSHNLGVAPASVVLTVYNNGLTNVVVPTVAALSTTAFQCFGVSSVSFSGSVAFSWAAFA